MKKLLLGAVSATLFFPQLSMAAEEVNVYSYRQAFLVEPLFKEFTDETGIKVNVKFAREGFTEMLKHEGRLSPADIILTTDVGHLIELSDEGLVKSVNNDIVNNNIPSQYRDSEGEWYALTLRTRNVQSSKDRVGRLPSNFDYMDLADPKWKGKVCTRSGKHHYNISLVSSIIAHHGEEKAKEWLEGFKDNLARKPQGNDRGQIKAVKEGLCDIAVSNSYYFGIMMADENQRSWAESVYINFPGQEQNGTHVNVSGMAMAKYAPNSENAIKLMEFLSDSKAQEMYAAANFEYPVKPGVQPTELVASWGEFNADALSLEKISQYRPAAVRLLDEVKFDL
ncbi:extracellular solute-binding protein [Photobacterium sp. BZF1]|uniref:extracellular solute-binding protein n=1 Tax=Photobacterium sp. BZF1 TaxID=1904457 RepID=UPI001653464E|nr:extracellular solute-binding protein [Photobacterium sp. BZF1]MBC7003692.1 extracellular solute-binding protein [Photobacterium sp. BZF1]